MMMTDNQIQALAQPKPFKTYTVEEAAKLMDVSVKLVKMAGEVMEHAPAGTEKSIWDGKLTVQEAHKLFVPKRRRKASRS
jgi:hypothetical protein